MSSFPAIYAIRCSGPVSPPLVAAFEGKTVVHDEEGTTITGTVVDQAELLGLIDRIANLGRELLDVRRLVASTATPRSPSAPTTHQRDQNRRGSPDRPAEAAPAEATGQLPVSVREFGSGS